MAMSPAEEAAAVALFNTPDENPFSKLSDAELVDKLGRTMAELAPISAEVEDMKAALRQRGNRRYFGTFYEANVFASKHVSWISERLVRYLHPNQLRHARKTTPTQNVEVSALRGRVRR